jgi:hypothetical protein
MDLRAGTPKDLKDGHKKAQEAPKGRQTKYLAILFVPFELFCGQRFFAKGATLTALSAILTLVQAKLRIHTQLGSRNYSTQTSAHH